MPECSKTKISKDNLYRQIRIAQNNRDEILELKLLRKLNELENKNA